MLNRLRESLKDRTLIQKKKSLNYFESTFDKTLHMPYNDKNSQKEG